VNENGGNATDSGRRAHRRLNHASRPGLRVPGHIGELAEPSRISPARGPPAWDDPPVDLGPDWEALAQASPKYVFNQEVQW
jgi:hypothetical protein